MHKSSTAYTALKNKQMTQLCTLTVSESFLINNSKKIINERVAFTALMAYLILFTRIWLVYRGVEQCG